MNGNTVRGSNLFFHFASHVLRDQFLKKPMAALGAKSFLLRVDSILKGLNCPAKQTKVTKVNFLWKNKENHGVCTYTPQLSKRCFSTRLLKLFNSGTSFADTNNIILRFQIEFFNRRIGRLFSKTDSIPSRI